MGWWYSGSVVVLSLSSLPEATGSHVHDKNMHTLLGFSGPIFFFPISLFFLSNSSAFILIVLLSFSFILLTSASIVSVFYIDAVFLYM